MARLEWNARGLRYFETGVDRVVLCTGEVDVPWVGVGVVREAPVGGEPRSHYIDGVKFVNVASSVEYAATIEAFSAPKEFDACDGRFEIQNGLYVTNQKRQTFDFCYRTLVGNEIQGAEHSYKLHLVYGALAEATDRNRSTIDSKITPETISWNISTLPPLLNGWRPSSHFIIDVRQTPTSLLLDLENILYGIPSADPRMPSVSELNSMFTA